MTTLKFSVVLCTYNGAAYLGEQLKSLLAQTRPADEIVIGDDGSTDGSPALLAAFAASAEARGIVTRVVRHQVNMGFVGNFSEMMGQATGDVLFLCDQDDVWSPEKLAAMEQRFVEDPSLVMLCSDARLVDEQGEDLGHTLFEALGLEPWELSKLHQGHAFDVFLRRSMVTGATAAFRRTLVDRALPVGRGWVHDEWLAVVAASIGRVDALEQPLIDYRQHARNQIGMRKRGLLDKWHDLVRPRREQFEAEVVRLSALQLYLDRSRAYACGAKLERKLAHLRNRIALGQRPRWLRLPLVVAEARAGSYRRYGTGMRTLIRDLLRHD